ncbi:MAG: hypothetical protein AABW88_00095 [Nanoarchaeota archaeon]
MKEFIIFVATTVCPPIPVMLSHKAIMFVSKIDGIYCYNIRYADGTWNEKIDRKLEKLKLKN